VLLHQQSVLNFECLLSVGCGAAMWSCLLFCNSSAIIGCSVVFEGFRRVLTAGVTHMYMCGQSAACRTLWFSVQQSLGWQQSLLLLLHRWESERLAARRQQQPQQCAAATIAAALEWCKGCGFAALQHDMVSHGYNLAAWSWQLSSA
jgi:hypothetical protein